MRTFFSSILSKLEEIFNPVVLGEKFALILREIVVMAVILIVFYLIWFSLKLIIRPSLRRSGTDQTTIRFVEALLKYSILSIGIITALGSAGIQISAVLASLGIVGLSIGFAARDALSNIISGILIYLDRPFVIGDLVEMEDFYGKVDKITLRSTRIITIDGKMLAVPNTQIINKTVASFTNFPHLRIDIAVTISVNESIDEARKILLDLVYNNPVFLETPAPKVIVRTLNDYNVMLELQVWLKDERQHIEERFNLREQVFNALNNAGIEMPLETFKLTPLEIKIASNTA